MVERQTPEIQIDEMKSALLRSGYLLEQRVRIAVGNRGYYVQNSDAYPDEVTGKSRELDINALTLSKAGPEEGDWAWNTILCECVNNPNPMVFFVYEQYVGVENVKYSGLPTQILSRNRDDEWESLSDVLKLRSFHHYGNTLVASQYCSFQQKRGSSGEWMALHPEDQNDSFNVISMALETEVREHYRAWTKDAQEDPKDTDADEESVNLTFYYPLFVLEGQLYTATIGEDGLVLDEAQHVQYVRHHFSSQRRRSYQIDVITESYLEEYLDLVDQEMKRISLRLQRNKRRVRRSITLLMARFENPRDLKAVRTALDGDFDPSDPEFTAIPGHN